MGMTIILGALAPIILNLLHLTIGIYVVMHRGSIMSLGFTSIGFLTKTIGMVFLTWLGVSIWWLLSGYMVTRLTFLYIYLILTLIPFIFMFFTASDKLKNKDK